MYKYIGLFKSIDKGPAKCINMEPMQGINIRVAQTRDINI